MASGNPAGFVQGQLLAQLRPSVTTPVLLYQVPSAPQGLRVEVTLILAALILGAGNNIDVALYHDDSGTTFDNDTLIGLAQRTNAGEDIAFKAAAVGGGIFVKPGGSIGVSTSSANDVNFSLYGINENIAVQRINR